MPVGRRRPLHLAERVLVGLADGEALVAARQRDVHAIVVVVLDDIDDEYCKNLDGQRFGRTGQTRARLASVGH